MKLSRWLTDDGALAYLAGERAEEIPSPSPRVEAPKPRLSERRAFRFAVVAHGAAAALVAMGELAHLLSDTQPGVFVIVTALGALFALLVHVVPAPMLGFLVAVALLATTASRRKA